MIASLRLWATTAALCSVIAGHAEAKQTFPKAPAPPPLPDALKPEQRKGQPLLLEADEMGYDRVASLVIARGNVEVVQGDQILQADQISYEQTTDLVRADGNVRILQPDGNVIFADHVALKQELKQGVVNNFRVRLADNSVFAAREAAKISDTVTVMKNGVYSPCKLPSCEEDKKEGKAPLWQMQARTIRKDDAAQEVYYRDAWLEFYGVPVLYTPYLSHPTPDAEATAGFLAPSYSRSTQLGYTLRTPYYIPFGSASALTLTPIYTTQEGPILAAEYRKLFANGSMQFNASGTDPDKRDVAGNVVPGQEFRGHIAGKGLFNLDPTWSTGFDFQRASDDTYMRRYNFSQDYTLTSRAFIEGTHDRTHAIAQGYAFQNLLVNSDPGQSPIALPSLSYETESAPGWMGSRWRMETSALALTRTGGSDTQRVSALAGWRAPYVSPQGHVLELDTQMRADAYNVADYVVPGTTSTSLASTQTFNGQEERAIPQASLTWRYPLSKPVGSARWIAEPLAGAAISPERGKENRIPNEDSQVLEFSDTNVFSFDHFPGLDEVESGARAFYGLRNTLQFESGVALYALAGQNYHQNQANDFPFTNDFNQSFSDYVGAIGAGSDWLSAVYRFRLAQQDFSFKRHDVSLQYSPGGGSLSVEYIRLENDPYIAQRNEISAYGTIDVTREWNLASFARRDLTGRYGWINTGGGVNYHNECLQWITSLTRSYTQDRDIKPNTSITTQIFLKNVN